MGKGPTLADLLKPLGYMTGQFGKNHLGDRNEFLPTVHGFDEFFGNLYHLNAEDEPEHPDYPKGTEFKVKFGPRGVLRCTATTDETPGEDPRFGKWGKQNCEDTGPLDKKRMETVDQEFLDATLDFIDRANRDRKPFLAWFNPSRMHIWTADDRRGAAREVAGGDDDLRLSVADALDLVGPLAGRLDRRLDRFGPGVHRQSAGHPGQRAEPFEKASRVRRGWKARLDDGQLAGLLDQRADQRPGGRARS